MENVARQTLEEARPLYLLPQDPLADEVLIPGFRVASAVDCMVGFFSSAVLSTLAPGLATYISTSERSLRLVISPFLRPEDQEAIAQGVAPVNVACSVLDDFVVTEDSLQQHTLRCLSWLLRTGRLEIKIALMEDALFHPKVWLFQLGPDVLAAHGSSNVTYAGIRKNMEQVAVSKSWADPNQRYTTEKLQFQFNRLWDGLEDNCIVIPLPDALRERLVQTYHLEQPPTEEELRLLYARAAAAKRHVSERRPDISFGVREAGFVIPVGLSLDQGPFEHQGRAVAVWWRARGRGVLEMATGSGKTITSIACAHKLYEACKPLLIVVAAPYVPVIQQWIGELRSFGLVPTDMTAAGGLGGRSAEVQRLRRRMRNSLSDVEAIVVSHDTLCTTEFVDAIRAFPANRLLIADEAHNLGRPSFIQTPPEFFEYRLALSATPVRQYDAAGTDALFAFFGDVVFRYPLEEAIGRCLVEYDYHIHPIELSHVELDKWYEITARIKENAWRSRDGEPDEYLAKLFRDRRAILETAEAKLASLRGLLEVEDRKALAHTLIYATDKGPEQLESVNALLREMGVMFHQLTAQETSNRDEAARIIRSFQDGEIQVLTAKRVLDEGVNIPQICKAFILASTTVERQWIQRRGRLLRICPAVNKTHGVIHDFVAMPPDSEGGVDQETRSLTRSELRRAQEFARLARNAGSPQGPLAVLDELVRIAYL